MTEDNKMVGEQCDCGHSCAAHQDHNAKCDCAGECNCEHCAERQPDTAVA